MHWLEVYPYWIHGGLITLGLYTLIAKRHLVKKVIGLMVLQTGAFLLFIALSTVEGGTAPILEEQPRLHVNPLPHVLILTAIVVGVSIMSVALALCVRIQQEWGTLESDELTRRESRRP